jgi:NlpC/P60 family protein
MRPPPDYPPAPYPFLAGGLTRATQGNPVISIAVKYLGIPYKWGGARPKTGFDCSGLVQYVFAQLGVSLPHYAAAQYYSPEAVWVSPNRLQPGDLVFFIGSDGTRKAPGHVGIYVGDGYLIDAPHTGAFVRVDSLNEPWFANNYVGAKRIVAVRLDARHLLHATGAASVPVVRPILLELTGPALGESPHLIAAVRTATRASAAGGYGLWAGVGLGGALLLIAGTAIYGRHRAGIVVGDPSRPEPNSL